MLFLTHPPGQSDTDSCQLDPPHCSDPRFLLSSRSVASVWPIASRPVSWSLSVPHPSLLGTTGRAVSPDCRLECSELCVLLLLDRASKHKLSSVTTSWGPIVGLEMALGPRNQLTLSIVTEAEEKFVQRKIRPTGGNRTCGPVS